jgi:hypothetical protein
LGVCPRCHASRTVGEHQFVESPHIEKIRAIKQVILRYKTEEKIRIIPLNKLDAVYLTKEQARILEYIMQIVNELTGQNFKVRDFPGVYILELRDQGTTQMLHFLDAMLAHLDSALSVEKTLADIVAKQNESD